MYVLVVFGQYAEDGDIDAVLGPFDTLHAAQERQGVLFGDRYRRCAVHRVTDALPEWAN